VYAPGTYTWNDWEWAVQEVHAHYERLCAGFPVDPRRVVLAGFSQGGGLAAWLALSGTIPARGLILVGPFLPDVNAVVPLLEEHDMRGRRAYLVAGLRDRYCYGVARQLAEILPRHGVACKLEVCADLEHMFPADFDQKLPAALEFVLG
jgi:predicted esterase